MLRSGADVRINADQLVDRLRNLNTTLYRLAQPVDKPRVLTDLLGDELLALRGLGIGLSEQRLSAGESFDEPLRRALRGNLTDSTPDLRRRAAVLLRDLSDADAADRVAARLAAGEEHVTEVLRADLMLLTRLPRRAAVPTLLPLLEDPALQNEAAAAVAAAARDNLLDPRQAELVREQVGPRLRGLGGGIQPAFVTLAGRLGGDAEMEVVGDLLDHPDPAVRRAAAQAWADSDRSLAPLAARAGDPIVQPIVITAALERGRNAATFQALIAQPPEGDRARQAWEQALVAMAARVRPDVVGASALTLAERGGQATLREALLTSAINAAPAEPPVDLLLQRAETRLDHQRARLAIADFETLQTRDLELDPAQLERVHRGLIRGALLTDQIGKAFSRARTLFGSPDGTFVQADADDPLIGVFIDTADEHARAGRKPLARQVLDGLRLLLGDRIRPGVAARIVGVERAIADYGATDR